MKTLLLAMAVFLAGCTEDEPENMPRDSGVGLYYENKEGMDLLNPETKGAYSEQSIKLYYLIEGEKVSAYQGNLDNPDHYTINRYNDKFYIGIDLSPYEDDKERSFTYIALNESDTDTIMCTFRPGTNLKRTVHYNGNLIWNSKSDDRVPVTIVK